MDEIRLVTLDPGHFHAALIQKQMYPEVSKRVAVYAPLGSDLTTHLERIARFNLRPQNPTSWELDIHASPDFLERMLKERSGNAVVLAGRNRAKIGIIRTCLEAGLHVLADKPWIIRAADLTALEEALELARRRGLAAYDIMTERHEITAIVQRELVNDPDVFGSILQGTESEPAVRLESVHHILKFVAGAPNPRPPWFFDIHEQGEGLSDAGTHLVDLVQWTLAPDAAIDYRTEIEVLQAKRWPLRITAAQFQQVTGEPGDELDYYCNTELSYTLRGVHTRLSAVWRWEAPNGAGDTQQAVYRGTKAMIEVRQGAEESYRPEVYVTPAEAGVKEALERRIRVLAERCAGIELEDQGARLRVRIPDVHRVGHEAHFAQVARAFFGYVRRPETLPAWENRNMLAKYYTTTTGVELSRAGNRRTDQADDWPGQDAKP